MESLSLHKIRLDGGTQSREAISEEVVEQYALEMSVGVKFPPVVIFYDGSEYWMADGFHRYRAAESIQRGLLECDVRQGTQRDAILYSVGANDTHGMRRSNADKRRAVLKLLNDTEWGKWSDGEIARRCGVSQNFTSDMRRSLKPDLSEARTYTTKHGTTTTMNTAKIGRTVAPVAEVEEPADTSNPDEADIEVGYTPPSRDERPPVASTKQSPTAAPAEPQITPERALRRAIERMDRAINAQSPTLEDFRAAWRSLRPLVLSRSL